VEEDADETCFFTHSDMLHSAPLCAGIAWDPATTTPYQNVYWVFDGHNGESLRGEAVGLGLGLVRSRPTTTTA